MTYCAHQHPSGWFCVLAGGHAGDHMSIRNNLMWKGSPGRPCFWAQDEGLSREATDELTAETDPTLTQGEIARARNKPAPRADDPPTMREGQLAPIRLPENKPTFTGRPCDECQSLNTIQNGKCLYCLECGKTGECG